MLHTSHGEGFCYKDSAFPFRPAQLSSISLVGLTWKCFNVLSSFYPSGPWASLTLSFSPSFYLKSSSSVRPPAVLSDSVTKQKTTRLPHLFPVRSRTTTVYIHRCHWGVSQQQTPRWDVLPTTLFFLAPRGSNTFSMQAIYLPQICCRNLQGYNFFILPPHPMWRISAEQSLCFWTEKEETHTHTHTHIPDFHTEMRSSPTCWINVESCGRSASDSRRFFGFCFVSSPSVSQNFDGSISEMHTAGIIHSL